MTINASVQTLNDLNRVVAYFLTELNVSGIKPDRWQAYWYGHLYTGVALIRQREVVALMCEPWFDDSAFRAEPWFVLRREGEPRPAHRMPLSEMLEANRDDDELCAWLRRAPLGGVRMTGGGAEPACAVRRVL